MFIFFSFTESRLGGVWYLVTSPSFLYISMRSEIEINTFLDLKLNSDLCNAPGLFRRSKFSIQLNMLHIQ